jgi:hypothetical protein
VMRVAEYPGAITEKWEGKAYRLVIFPF